jgi:hypothetical protein
LASISDVFDCTGIVAGASGVIYAIGTSLSFGVNFIFKIDTTASPPSITNSRQFTSVPMSASAPLSLCWDGANLWVSLQGSGSSCPLYKCDPDTLATTGTLVLNSPCLSMTSDGTAVWGAQRDNYVVKVDIAACTQDFLTGPQACLQTSIAYDSTTETIWVAGFSTYPNNSVYVMNLDGSFAGAMFPDYGGFISTDGTSILLAAEPMLVRVLPSTQEVIDVRPTAVDSGSFPCSSGLYYWVPDSTSIVITRLVVGPTPS